MNILDYLLKEADFQERKISDLSDTPSSDGMSAVQLKAYFDYIPKTLIAMGALNGVINLLASSQGAANIGAGVTGLTGTTVQEILETAKALIDNQYTKNAVDSMLAEKADANTVETMLKSVSFDANTGIFTFEEAGGTVYTFDTALEKIAVNFGYDPEGQALTLTLADGSVQNISLAEFITVNEIKGSDPIQVSTSGGVTTLSIKNGSITDSMLSSSLLSAAREYANAAEVSAQSAAASEANAKTYANSAAAAANRAASSESVAEIARVGAENAKRAAEEAAQRAENSAGGDFVTNESLNNALEGYATKKYVEDNGGKIDSISVNGVPQAIGANKNVDIEVPDPDMSGYAPMYTYGTEDLEVGVTPLEEGALHLVYEA